jgi:hypothetical protein
MNIYILELLRLLSYGLYLLAGILIIYHYWNTTIGEDEKFKTLVAIIGSISIFFTIYSIYLESRKQLEEATSRSITFYESAFKGFLDDTIKFFIANPKMNYYYQDLFTNSGDYTEKQRNKVLEGQVTIIMMSRADSIIRYIDEFKATDLLSDSNRSQDITVVEAKFKNIMSSFFGSKIFVENWEKVKTNLNSKETLRYVKDNFNY